MERAKNEQRVILAYDDSTCLFDDQYSMLLWGKVNIVSILFTQKLMQHTAYFN